MASGVLRGELIAHKAHIQGWFVPQLMRVHCLVHNGFAQRVSHLGTEVTNYLQQHYESTRFYTLPAEPFFTRRQRKNSAEIVLTLYWVCASRSWSRFQTQDKSQSHSGRHVDFRTEGSTLALPKIRCAHCLNRFDRSDWPRNLGCSNLRLDTISAEHLLLALWWVLGRLCSQGAGFTTFLHLIHFVACVTVFLSLCLSQRAREGRRLEGIGTGEIPYAR